MEPVKKDGKVFAMISVDEGVYERLKKADEINIQENLSRAVNVSFFLVEMFNVVSSDDPDLAFKAFKSVPLKARNDVEWFLRDLGA